MGISFHADHAWTWFEPSQRYDLEGEKAGIWYDGTLTKEDGKGKWWEGLDPQKLYQQRHPMSKGSWNNGAIHGQWAWGNGACRPSQEFVTNFYDRTLDAIKRFSAKSRRRLSHGMWNAERLTLSLQSLGKPATASVTGTTTPVHISAATRQPRTW